MEQQDPAEECVVVVCPTCRARLNPRRSLIGQQVRCPDCGVAVRVVDQTPQDSYALSDVVAPNESANDETTIETDVASENESAGDEYRVSGSEQPVDQPRFVKVKCGVCGAVLHPRAELIGKRVRCPDCFKPVLVVEPPAEPVAKDYRVQGEYDLDAPPPENPMAAFVPKTLRDEPVDDEPESEPEEPPPDSTGWYSSGIFTFPWQEKTTRHWLTLTLFAAFANGTTAYALGLVAGMGEGGDSLSSIGFAAKLAFTVLLAASAWLLMIAYASGCVVAIIRETASGNDEVSDWHDAEFPEAGARALEVIFPMAGAGAIGYGVYAALSPLLGAGTIAQIAGTLVATILYPLMLLSVLEAGAFWVVVNAPTLRLIFGFFMGWLLINVEMGIVTGGWWLFTWAGAKFLPIITAILAAPIYAAAIMIDARLLGRFLLRADELARACDKTQADDDDDDEEDESDDD